MSVIVTDASLTLQWFLEDEADRGYSLAVLQRLQQDSAVVPSLRFYEMGNGLMTACRRKRIAFDQAIEYLKKVRKLPIPHDEVSPDIILNLPDIANRYDLTNYDAAYLELAIRRRLMLATTDDALRKAAVRAGVALVKPV